MADEVVVASIKQFHRRRCFAMEQRKRMDLALGSYLRLQLGWRKDLPEAERKAIAKAASDLMDDPDTEDNVIIGTRMAREPFETLEKTALKHMEKLAEQLPIWESFGKAVRGFGAASLAVIVAEAGDLANYATEAKLWKRMGLAVMDGVRQGGLSKNAKAEEWIEHGYNKQRRSRMWNIGETLFKAQVRQVKDADGKDTGERVAFGPYGESYLRRRLLTQQTHPEWWVDKDGVPKLDPKTRRPMSDHGNNDARRYMEKRLLRDLWRAWRRTNGRVASRPIEPLSAADSQEAA